MLRTLKFDKKSDVKPPNRIIERPDSDVHETTEEERVQALNKSKPKQIQKDFNPPHEDLEQANAWLRNRRRRIKR